MTEEKNKPAAGMYKVHSAYSERATPINIVVDDNGVVVECDYKSGGGKQGVGWIKMYTNPYTKSDTPWFQLFEYAIRGTYIITGPYNDAGENMAYQVTKIADDESDG